MTQNKPRFTITSNKHVIGNLDKLAKSKRVYGADGKLLDSRSDIANDMLENYIIHREAFVEYMATRADVLAANSIWSSFWSFIGKVSVIVGWVCVGVLLGYLVAV